jgi:hypothetical protein
MFPIADINIHRCVYLCLLRISMFPTADIVHRYVYLCLLRISMFPTADMNVHRCGHRCSLLGKLVFTNADFLFTVNKFESCLITSMIVYSHSLICTVSWQNVNYIQSRNDMVLTIKDIVSRWST